MAMLTDHNASSRVGNVGSAASESEQRIRRRRRGLLHMYYGMDSAEVSSRKENPLDIDGTGFKPENYMEHLLKESSLNELFVREQQMRRGTIMNRVP